MKKITTLAILTAAAFPAFAQDTADPVPASTELTELAAEPIAPVAEYAESVAADQPKSKIKFPRGMQIGVGASATGGLNGFVGYANKNFESFWWKRLGVRFDFASTAPIKSYIDSAIDSALDGGMDLGDGMTLQSGSFQAQHIGAMVDIYPFGNTWFLGGWRLTGGYVSGKTKLTANLGGELAGAPGDAFEFELEGIQYRYKGNDVTASALVDWKYSGPYLGTGFDLGLFWGIKIFMDAGVVFTSKTASADLDIPLTGLETNDMGTWKPVNNPALEAQLDSAKATALDDANDMLKDIKFYPLVKLGFMYRF
jgi:hypothetical protein